MTNKLLITDESIKDILNSIIKLDCLGVKAPTGTGKSTTLVKAIYDEGASVICVQPTIISCGNLHDYIKGQYEAKGQYGVVGMAAEGSVNYNIDKIRIIRGGKASNTTQTGIAYCTSGHIKNLMFDCVHYANEEMRRNGAENYVGVDLNFCGVLMVDEAHSGSLDADMILFLYRYLKDRGAILPKLLLSSATLRLENTPFADITTYEVVIDSFDVDVKYHNRTYPPVSRDLYIDCANVIKDMHLNTPLDDGDSDVWLVFCPGKEEIKSVKRHLETEGDNGKVQGLEILCIYGEKGSRENKASYNTSVTPGVRRVIISTNIAESAITVEGVSGVFDTMTEKYTIMSDSFGSKLVTDHIAKSSADQRKGRTGRTKPGFCYRMTTKEIFNIFKGNRSREIERVSLNNTIIQMLDANIDPKMILEDFDVKESSINQAISVLLNLKMFVNPPGVAPKVTEKGRFSTKVPFSVYGSSIIYEWAEYTNGKNQPIYPMVVLVSLIEGYGPNYFSYPFYDGGNYSENEKSHWDEYYQKYSGLTDLHILCNLWNDVYENFSKFMKTKNIGNKNLFYSYCNTNKLNAKKINDAFRNVNMTMQVLKNFNYKVYPKQINVDSFINDSLPIIRSTYYNRVFTRYNGNMEYILNDSDSHSYKLETKRTLSDSQTFHQKIIALGTHQTGSNRKITLYVSCEGVKFISMAEPKTATSYTSYRENMETKRRSRPKNKVLLPTVKMIQESSNYVELAGFVSELSYGKTTDFPTIKYTSEILKNDKHPKANTTFDLSVIGKLNLEPLDFSDPVLANVHKEPDYIDPRSASIHITMSELGLNENGLPFE